MGQTGSPSLWTTIAATRCASWTRAHATGYVADAGQAAHEQRHRQEEHTANQAVTLAPASPLAAPDETRTWGWNDRWDSGCSAIRKLWQQERQAKRRQRATLSSPQTPGQSSAPAAPMDQTRSSERPKKHSSALPTAQQQTPPAAAVPT